MAIDGIRINKYLSECGICSRREADRLLEEGRIKVNGNLPEPGYRVQEGDIVTLDGRNVSPAAKDEPVVLAFNKPAGIVCSTVSQGNSENIIDCIGYRSRIFPIGRLDMESRGLILLTNIGSLVNSINRSVNGHEKEYEVRCGKRVSDEFIDRMRNGVKIRVPGRETDASTGKKIFRTVITKKCIVEKTDEYSFRIILTQGLNRQIRRMTDALGNSVADLKRIRIMNIELGKLKEGSYREIRDGELDELMKELHRKF